MLNLKNKENIITYDFLLTVNKNEYLPELSLSNSEIYFDNDNSTIFTYNKLIQEYNLITGENHLYLDLGNNKLAYLYSHEIYEDGNELYTLFEKDGIYSMTENSGKMQSLSYTPKKYFEKLVNGFNSNNKQSFLSNFHQNRLRHYANEHTDIMVNNYAYIPSAEHKVQVDNFKKYFMKYKMSECLIPCKNVVNNINSMINHYLAFQELDTDNLLNNYMILCAFSDFGSSTVELIAPLIYEPQNVDLEELSDGLLKKSSNIDYLINLYLENELKYSEQYQNSEKGDR